MLAVVCLRSSIKPILEYCKKKFETKKRSQNKIATEKDDSRCYSSRSRSGRFCFFLFDFAFYPKGTIHLFQGFFGGLFFSKSS